MNHTKSAALLFHAVLCRKAPERDNVSSNRLDRLLCKIIDNKQRTHYVKRTLAVLIFHTELMS